MSHRCMRDTCWFLITQKVSSHILYHLSAYHVKYALYDQAKNISQKFWTLRWRLRLNMCDVRYLLAVDCGKCVI